MMIFQRDSVKEKKRIRKDRRRLTFSKFEIKAI
jgi:hypothetical protein